MGFWATFLLNTFLAAFASTNDPGIMRRAFPCTWAASVIGGLTGPPGSFRGSRHRWGFCETETRLSQMPQQEIGDTVFFLETGSIL